MEQSWPDTLQEDQARDKEHADRGDRGALTAARYDTAPNTRGPSTEDDFPHSA